MKGQQGLVVVSGFVNTGVVFGIGFLRYAIPTIRQKEPISIESTTFNQVCLLSTLCCVWHACPFQKYVINLVYAKFLSSAYTIRTLHDYSYTFSIGRTRLTSAGNRTPYQIFDTMTPVRTVREKNLDTVEIPPLFVCTALVRATCQCDWFCLCWIHISIIRWRFNL